MQCTHTQTQAAPKFDSLCFSLVSLFSRQHTTSTSTATTAHAGGLHTHRHPTGWMQPTQNPQQTALTSLRPIRPSKANTTTTCCCCTACTACRTTARRKSLSDSLPACQTHSSRPQCVSVSTDLDQTWVSAMCCDTHTCDTRSTICPQPTQLPVHVCVTRQEAGGRRQPASLCVLHARLVNPRTVLSAP